jgi:multicomponent Na+:H+ antiporter subunit F
MSELGQAAAQIALIILILLLIPCVYRVFASSTPVDRLQAVDIITTLLIGIIVVLAMIQGTSYVIDVALALAAFAFIGTLALARFLAEGRIF